MLRSAPIRNPPPAPGGEREAILAEQIRQAAARLPAIVIPDLLGTILVAAWLWPTAERWRVSLWLTWAVAVSALALLQSRRIPAARPEHARRMATEYWLAATFGGLRWGVAGGLLLDPASVVQQAVLACFIFGAGLASVALALYPAAFYASLAAAIVPFTLRLALIGEQESLLIAGCGVLVLLFAAMTGRRVMALNLGNLRLIQELERERNTAEAARQAAEQANRAKSRFLASASHDLRQPIHALGLFVAALKQRIQYPEVAHLVQRIETSVGVMEEMFNALLDLSRLSTGSVTIELRPIRIAELLAEIDLQFGPSARAKGLDFRIRPTSLSVLSDVNLLRQIVRNLVSNAVRYTVRGGVLVAARRRGAAARIEVWDTGPGIAEEKQQEIFVEFVRLTSTGATDDRGLGIGLATAQQAAQLLGHRVEVRSRLGHGSRFSVEAKLARLPAPAPAAGQTLDRLRGAFVLAIDDEETVVESMRLLFTQWGCHTAIARSVEGALAALAEHDRLPDLIVTDYQLAGGATGLDAVERIHSEVWPEIPVLIITGATTPIPREEVAERGYTVLHKPIVAARLKQAMNAALERQAGGAAARS